MSNLAVSYAAIILADADVEITGDKILSLVRAANFEDVEPIYAQLFAGAVNKADKKELLTAFGTAGAVAGGAAGAVAGGDAAAPAEAAAEEKKKEESEEDSDMDMGMLF